LKFFIDYRYISCPKNLKQIKLNGIFKSTNSFSWQTNVLCYKIISSALLKFYPQHICCYDSNRGFLVKSGPNAGFLYTGSTSDVSLAG
jgi:hypothetical protein